MAGELLCFCVGSERGSTGRHGDANCGLLSWQRSISP